jgi:hypothetical protein
MKTYCPNERHGINRIKLKSFASEIWVETFNKQDVLKCPVCNVYVIVIDETS